MGTVGLNIVVWFVGGLYIWTRQKLQPARLCYTALLLTNQRNLGLYIGHEFSEKKHTLIGLFESSQIKLLYSDNKVHREKK